MRAGMPDGALPSSVRLGQEQLALLEDIGTPGRADQPVASLRAMTPHVRATATICCSNFADSNQEVFAALLTDPSDGSLLDAVLLGDKQLHESNGSMPSALIAPRAAGHKVIQAVIEPIEVDVINDKMASARNPSNPRHRLPAPMARMGSGSDRIKEHDAMLHHLPSRASHWVSMSDDRLIARHLPSREYFGIQDTKDVPVEQGGPPCRAR